MKQNIRKLSILMLALVLFFTGCSVRDFKKTVKVVERTHDLIEENSTNNDKDIEITENTETETTIEDLSELKFTDYYAINGPAQITFDIPGPGNINYLGFDELDRPLGVIANINYDLIAKEREEDRENISKDPVGWGHNDKCYIEEENGDHYKGYFYNRSHLLADSLGGSPEPVNMITGTRTQNVGIKNQGGMAYSETLARNMFAEPTDVTLIYQVKPLYSGDELLPRIVEVDIKSSDGKVNEHIIVSNTANGHTINYKTAEWSKDN